VVGPIFCVLVLIVFFSGNTLSINPSFNLLKAVESSEIEAPFAWAPIAIVVCISLSN
jgi:hypothetical protein